MSNNVGGVNFSVDVAGIKQSITDVKTLTKQLTNLDLSIQRLKTSAKNLRVSPSGSGIDPTKQTNMAKKHGQAMEENKRRALAAKKAIDKLALAKTKLAAKTAAAAKKVSTMNSRTKTLTGNIQKNSKAVQTWWSRFGTVAIGFAVVYRGIYLVQRAVMDLSGIFLRGASIMDEYNEGVATTAGMIALITTGMGSFSNRFEAISSTLRETMQHSIRLAPKYRLSVEEISVAYRELGQFGVIVTKQLVEDSLVTISMIKEISASTGSTTRQIRQEIQSLFTGTARVTDQFARTIKLTMPKLFKTLQDGAISAQDKWILLGKHVAKFREAAIRANQTLRGQTQVISNSLAVISAKALEGSGIYDAWIDRLIKFNDRLFDANGNLGDLGKTLFTKFTAAWNAMNNTLVVLKEMYKVGGMLVQAIKDLPDIVHDTATGFLKWSVALTLTTFALGTVRTLLMGILKLSGITGLLGVFKKIAGFVAAGGISTFFSTAVLSVRGLLKALVLIPAALYLGVKVGEQLGGMFVALGTIVQQFAPQLATKLGDMWETVTVKAEIYWTKFRNFIWARDLDSGIAELEAKLTGITETAFAIDWDAVGNARTEYIDFAAKANKEVFDTMVEDAAEVGKDIITALKPVGEALVSTVLSEENKAKFAAFGDTAKDALGLGAGGWLEGVKGKFAPLLDAFDALFGGRRRTKSLFDADALGLGGLETNSDSTFQNIIERGKKAFEELSTLGQKMSKNLAGTWSKVFGGEITNTKDLFESVMDSILKSFQDTLADMTTAYMNIFLKQIMNSDAVGGASNDLVSLLGNAIGSIATSFMGSDKTKTTPTVYGPRGSAVNSRANGGMITEPVVGIGLNTGQAWSFGERGPEEVIPNGGSKQATSVNFTLNVVNETGGQVEAEQSEPRFDGEQMIVDIVLKDFNSGGKTFSAFGGGK